MRAAANSRCMTCVGVMERRSLRCSPGMGILEKTGDLVSGTALEQATSRRRSRHDAPTSGELCGAGQYEQTPNTGDSGRCWASCRRQR